MIIRFLFVAIAFLVLCTTVQADGIHPEFEEDSPEFLDYIEKWKKIAIREMERAGIPASIKLAQGLLESNAGRSTLARKANNHFGMKCGSSWKGKTFYREDDDYDEFGNLMKSCFRKYRKATDSFIAHSEFLRDPRKAHRYGFLFRIQTTDYKRWARGLKKAGYATAGNYDSKLISLIERFELYRFDQMTENAFPERPDDEPIAGLDLRKVNDAKVVFAKNNITLQELSAKADVSIKALKKYNEKLPEIHEALPDDYRVFIQPKRNRFLGKKKWHYVKEGETMFDISQEYGVKLKKLLCRNRISEGAQPQEDERIKLKGWKVRKSARPRVTSEPVPEKVPVVIDGDDEFMDDDITPEDPTIPPTTRPDVPVTDPNPPIVQPDPPASELYYTVMKGDTLYSISRRFGLTVDQLMRMNNLATTTLSIDQVLKVK
ncbi:MAG: glucosaminidase domain-containing protein [Bacteroidota bacterium]